MEEFEVEKILDSLVIDAEYTLYYIKWKNYSNEYNTWEPKYNLGNCHKILHNFRRNGADQKRTEYEKCKLFLTQHTKEEIDVILKKHRSKGCLNFSNMSRASGVEIHKLINRFVQNKSLFYNNEDIVEARSVLLIDWIISRRSEQLLHLKTIEDKYNAHSSDDGRLFLENNFDLDIPPVEFEYISQSIPREHVVLNEEPVIWCTCKNNCSSNRDVCCSDLNESEHAYCRRSGKLQVSKGAPIYECNKLCSCDVDCKNRVIQKGIKVPLLIFKTKNGRGWGVKTTEKIKAGTFVCEYVGEILTQEESRQLEDSNYLFNLDFNLGNETSHRASNKNMKEVASIPPSHVKRDSNNVSTRRTSKGRACNSDGKGVAPTPSSHVQPNGNDVSTHCTSKRSVSNKDDDETCKYVLDAKNLGNVSHFINHSCDPNLEVFAAYINCINPDLHHVALFAKRNIAKNEELSFCYLETSNSISKKGNKRRVRSKNDCKCLSKNCKGFFYLG